MAVIASLVVISLFVLALASLHDITLDSPDITLDSPLFRGSSDESPTAIPTISQSEDHMEARWHLYYGILAGLRGIREQEETTPLNRKLGVETALQHLQIAHELEPENNWVIFNIGLMQIREGHYNFARQNLELVTKSANTFLQDKSLQMRGYAHEFDGQITEAKALYESVKWGKEIPYDNMEPEKPYYFRTPQHNYMDFREFLADIVVFHELYEQYLTFIEELGLTDEFRPERAEDPREGYFFIHEGRQNVREAGDFFVKSGFVVLQGFINPIEVKIIGRWFRFFRTLKMLKSFDAHLQRYTGHCDRISYYYHSRLLNLHSRLSQTVLKPTYSYISYYTPIAEARSERPWLQGHTDRDDNEFTSSVQVFNVDSERNQAESWPIWVDKNETHPAFASWREPPINNEHSIDLHQQDGDSILFRGRQHNHWRGNMPLGTSETLTFLLHYVHDDFDLHDYKVTRGGRDRLAGQTKPGY